MTYSDIDRENFEHERKKQCNTWTSSLVFDMDASKCNQKSEKSLI